MFLHVRDGGGGACARLRECLLQVVRNVLTPPPPPPPLPPHAHSPAGRVERARPGGGRHVPRRRLLQQHARLVFGPSQQTQNTPLQMESKLTRETNGLRVCRWVAVTLNPKP